MILTQPVYNDLWTNPAPNGFGMPIHMIPSYHQYLQRVVYQQDYLDLFKHGKTETYNRTLIRGRWYINMTTSPTLSVLGVSESDLYTIVYLGNLMLRVEYDHPFKKELKDHKKRSIKYVLIGEAAFPSPTYFYNIFHGETAYIKAPYTAFRGGALATKIEKLIALADEGVVLFDLFPFAISYRGIRNALTPIGLNKFIELEHELLHGAYAELLSNQDLRFSFLCGANHARAIIRDYGAKYKLNFQSIQCWIPWGAYPNALNPAIVNNRHEILPPIGRFGTISEFKSIGKSGSGYPHEIPIRFAFDLPKIIVP